MIIRVIYCDKNCNIIEETSRLGNSKYLCQPGSKFKYLSEVEVDDHAYFDSTDMNNLIEELKIIKLLLNNQQDIQHIDNIIKLATKCKKSENLLVFEGLVLDNHRPKE